MKARIKFTKTGHMKFIGHLDTMRYFQKAIRRAGLPAAFSGGYSPHMIMSFAVPLGVGMTSLGEYFDIEFTEDVPTDEIVERLNAVMVDGVSIVSARKVEDGKASNVMALVAAADYFVLFREGKAPLKGWEQKLSEFMAQKEIIVTKKTKKSEKEVDIRPNIYDWRAEDGGVFLKLASASANYTKPELVLDTFLKWTGEDPQPFAYMVERREIYASNKTDNGSFVPMEALGEKVE